MNHKISLGLLLVCACATTGASAQNAGTAGFRGNAAHTGEYSGAGVPQFTRVRWQFKTNGQVLSSPVVARGTVYVGSSDHNLYALDSATGTLRWKFPTHGRVTSSPAVADGVIYFLSYDSFFYAVDAETGKEKWKFQTGGERRFAAKHIHGGEPAAETMPDPFDFFLSSPVVEDSVVYFGSGDTNVYALDAAAGALKWKFKTGDVVHASPALDHGTLYIGSWDTNFYALEALTGKKKWRFKTGEDHDIHNQEGIQASAAVADGVVYFGCRDSKFYALDAATGKQLWAYPNKGSWVISSAAVRGGKVYFATSDTALLHAVDAKTGAEVFSLPFHRWPFFSSPAIARDTLYLGSHAGKLYAVDLKTQKPAWSFDTDGEKANGAAYTKPDLTPNYEAAFFDFFYDDMVSGVQKMLSVGAVLSSPVVDGDTVYFGSSDGNVYALM